MNSRKVLAGLLAGVMEQVLAGCFCQHPRCHFSEIPRVGVLYQVARNSILAIASASYRIEKPQIPENRKGNRQKIGKIGEK